MLLWGSLLISPISLSPMAILILDISTGMTIISAVSPPAAFSAAPGCSACPLYSASHFAKELCKSLRQRISVHNPNLMHLASSRDQSCNKIFDEKGFSLSLRIIEQYVDIFNSSRLITYKRGGTLLCSQPFSPDQVCATAQKSNS